MFKLDKDLNNFKMINNGTWLVKTGHLFKKTDETVEFKIDLYFLTKSFNLRNRLNIPNRFKNNSEIITIIFNLSDGNFLYGSIYNYLKNSLKPLNENQIAIIMNYFLLEYRYVQNKIIDVTNIFNDSYLSCSLK